MEVYPRGHFCNILPGVYLFSRPLNQLDYDPSYPKNPITLAQYIRKWRKDKGLTIRQLAEEIGIHEFTLIKWEGGRVPRFKKQITMLEGAVPGVEGFFQA
jgi:DNA-binding XRE family transcriptional regulator